MSPLYKLRDYKESFKFEKEHPKELRWDDKYKLYMLTEDKATQGIWLKDKTDLVGEIILTWQSKNVVHIDSFTVMPSHRGQGLGHELMALAIEWGINSDFKVIIGEARKGASWKIIERFGAVPILTYQDWAGTKEEYVSFKLDV